MKPLTVGSLFSGIGGLDLGLERAGMHVVWQSEIDPYASRVLKKHWPDVPNLGDITEITTFPYADIICGGFPCQDVSDAGKRTGITGGRSGLYRPMVQAIRMVRPIYGLLENVAALLGRGMGRVLGDLAEIGYDAEWDCLPAGAFTAHHLRDRVFIIASCSDAECLRLQGEWTAAEGSWSREQFERLVQAELRLSIPAGSIGGVSDGVRHRSHRLRCLGNAVVPQVAEWIGRRIVEAHVKGPPQ